MTNLDNIVPHILEPSIDQPALVLWCDVHFPSVLTGRFIQETLVFDVAAGLGETVVIGRCPNFKVDYFDPGAFG